MLYKTRNIVVFLGLLIVSTPLFSQEKKDTVKHKILLVPFKPTMLMSEIGKAVNSSTHLSYTKITEAFRSSLDLALYTTFRQSYTATSLIQTPKKGDTTLAYTYASVGYKFDLQPGDSSGESHAEFDKNQQKNHFIKNGQLQVPMDHSKRFMNVDLINPKLLPFLYKKYGADIFIFINELDIRNVANTESEDLTASNFRRQVTVQYSIVNAQKQYLAEGILTTYFPSNVNDPKVIGEKYFTLIAQDMVKELNKGLLKLEQAKGKKTTTSHIKTLSNTN
ncbi:MAG TPA: hypothetical protein VK809_06390 [Bacteroidia bacterium]|nr:hypothetical protein [Bacteroidia bacterium]